jgi:hypothetical protein
MDSDRSGKVYGLVTIASDPTGTTTRTNYLVERTDVATRVVEAKSIVQLSLGKMVRARHDPDTQSLVVGYAVGTQTFPTDPYPGHRAALLPYQ